MTVAHSGSPAALDLHCHDGYVLGGHYWPVAHGEARGTVIVNPATGVLARYYHRYAGFLAQRGLAVLTYDYRGIGASRPRSLRRSGIRWKDWGELDFAAAVSLMRRRHPDLPLTVVGHSIGGFLPGFAANATEIDRMLTVGAQFAWCGDYAAGQRLGLIGKWHIAMPVLTTLCGYFPGRRLGWLEDLPAGVAHDWSFRRPRMELTHRAEERAAVLARFAAVTAPILAVAVSDDPLAPPAAVARGLRYYTGAERRQVLLRPQDLGQQAVGHFSLFHDRNRDGFWTQSCRWIEDGADPWTANSPA